MQQNKLQRALAKDLDANRFEETENGLYFPKHKIHAHGVYRVSVNGGEWDYHENLVTKEGMMHILNIGIGGKAKTAGYFLALHSGNTAPAANWTAANYASVASEIVSLTEGYSNANRPAFATVDATDQTYIDNYGREAKVNIVATSQLTITGSAVLSTNTRGGTTGVLISATKYPAAYTLNNGDTFDIGYRISLSE